MAVLLLLAVVLSSIFDCDVADDIDACACRPSRTIESSSGRVGALTKPNKSLASVKVTGVFETYSEASAIVETRMVMNNTLNDDDDDGEKDETTGPVVVEVLLVVAAVDMYVVDVLILTNTTLQSGPARKVDSGMIDESQPTMYPSNPFVDWKYSGKNCGNIALWKECNQYNRHEYTTTGDDGSSGSDGGVRSMVFGTLLRGVPLDRQGSFGCCRRRSCCRLSRSNRKSSLLP